MCGQWQSADRESEKDQLTDLELAKTALTPLYPT